MISEDTEVKIKKEPIKEISNVPNITYDDVGGLRDAMQKVREMIELPLRHPEIFERLGIDPPKGVLLYGAPGTGKTLLANAVANESDANFYYVGGPEIISKYVGESEERLRKLFAEAQENAPSIIFVDEIDAIAPKREEVMGEVEKRMVSQLLTIMDGLKARGEVIVIGATNRPDSLDPALRRPGRFDREIEIGVPDKRDRNEILQIHVRNMPLSEDVDVTELANVTHGYTGADLSLLTKEAAIKALRRILPEINIEDETISQEILDKIRVTREDFFSALHEIQPSALREVYIERPSVKWDDIGGNDEIKRQVQEAVELPLKRPEIFDKMGIRPIKGVLLYGPPGTGKTLLAKAVANESESNFISISGAQILTKYVGESEKALREIFRKARSASPCVLFIDEIDAIAPRRSGSGDDGNLVVERIVDTLLTEMDGLKSLKNVVVIAATNRPDIIDTALMRPGRFDRIIEVTPPDEKARLEIFKICTTNMPLEKDVDLKELSRVTDGYTGADIDNLVRESGMCAIREGTKKVSAKHFEMSFKSIVPSIRKEHVESLNRFKTTAATMYR
jgi:transitional endoplasmic reticulum ATPase